MLILYSSKFNLSSLRNLCKLYMIKNCSKYKKMELLEILNTYKSVCYIQKFVRRKLMISDECPITLEKLVYPFVSLKNNKTFRYYSLDGVIDYYNATKDFRDPFTKEEIKTNKIVEINKVAKFYKRKPIIISKRPQVNVQQRTELLTILCCLNDIINNIMSTIELSYDYIYKFALPQTMSYIYYLILRCRNETRGVLQHFINILDTHNDIKKYHIINYINIIMINENL